MVQLATASTADDVEPPVATWLGDSPDADATFARYAAAGDRMRVIADVGLKICAVLAVLVLVAWALGLLPGAVKLF